MVGENVSLSRGRSYEAIAAFTRQGGQTGGLCQVASPGLGLGHCQQRMRLLRGRCPVYCRPVPPQGLLCCEVDMGIGHHFVPGKMFSQLSY